MDNSLENVFDALGLSDGENVDMLRPVREPCAPIGRASHRHSSDYPDPTDMLYSDEESCTLIPKPFSLGKAFMYDDPYSEEEGYLPISSMGYPKGGTELPKSCMNGDIITHGSHYIRPALQGSQSLYSGVRQESVVRCSSPVEDHDFVPPSENFGDPITQVLCGLCPMGNPNR